MATALEAEISTLLKAHGDVAQVGEELLNRWRHNLLNKSEQEDCAQFLVAAGLFPLFFEHLESLSSNEQDLPWTALAEGIGRSGILPTRMEIEALLEASAFHDGTESLLQSQALDVWDPDLAIERDKVRQAKATRTTEKRQALREKLVFMRANRLVEQEERVIDEMRAMFPEEPEFHREHESFKVRWARDIVANASSATEMTDEFAWKADRLTPEQLTAKQVIFERAKDMAANDPNLGYDLAVSLHLMDFNAEALDVLSMARPTPAGDWLRLELMIQARQFVNALEEAGRLEISYAGNPDAMFAAVYARARALRGLGQNAYAVELLRSLVRVRPHYKSAFSLLMDWSGGDV